MLMAAIRDKNVASLVPTSYASVRQICRAFDWRRPVTLVEYGPGTGAFTKYLLKRLHPESTLIAIELNRKLAIRLRRFSQHRTRRKPRFVVVCDNAKNVREIVAEHDCRSIDYALSGIPFSFIPESTKRQIIQHTHELLAPGGTFHVYQVSFHVRPFLQETFGPIRSSRALLNVPPLCVMVAGKPGNSHLGAVKAQLGRQTLEPAVLVDARQR